jgi:hypothetical protein
MFTGHYLGANNGSRRGERSFINRQPFSSLERAVWLLLAVWKMPVEPYQGSF